MQDFFDAVEPLDMAKPYNPDHDKGLAVRFYFKLVRNEVRSAETNLPKCDELEYVEIVSPGNSKSIVDRPVNESDKVRFAAKYAQFKERRAEVLDGTSLTEWPQIGRTLAEELKGHRVHTVEQLAALSDASLQNIGLGGKELQKKAQIFLQNAKDAGLAQKLASEASFKDDRIKELEAKVKDLTETVEKLTSDKTPKRRGE